MRPLRGGADDSMGLPPRRPPESGPPGIATCADRAAFSPPEKDHRTCIAYPSSAIPSTPPPARPSSAPRLPRRAPRSSSSDGIGGRTSSPRRWQPCARTTSSAALVASPHKERAATLLDGLSDDARASGAVNTIVRDGAKLRGYNSDLDGVRAGLAAILPKVQGKWPRAAVVLGAGGGARAAVAVLIQSGVQRVTVFNRHLHKAEALVAHLNRTARLHVAARSG